MSTLFEDDVYYSECWGPEYSGFDQIATWFTNWNENSKCLIWNIKNIENTSNNTYVTWYFQYETNNTVQCINGISKVIWKDKISEVHEFCTEIKNTIR